MNKKFALGIYAAVIALIFVGFIFQTAALFSDNNPEPLKQEKRFYISKDRIVLSQKGIYVYVSDAYAPVQVESIACDEQGLYIPEECLCPRCHSFACTHYFGYQAAKPLM